MYKRQVVEDAIDAGTGLFNLILEEEKKKKITVWGTRHTVEKAEDGEVFCWSVVLFPAAT